MEIAAILLNSLEFRCRRTGSRSLIGRSTTKFMTKHWARALTLPFLFILYCCSSSTVPSERPSVRPDGASLNLKASHQLVVGNLDQVGYQPFTNTDVAIPPADITMSGWAVDGKAESLAGGVDVAIDGSPYKAEYGVDRPDVAKAIRVPGTQNLDSPLSYTLHDSQRESTRFRSGLLRLTRRALPKVFR